MSDITNNDKFKLRFDEYKLFVEDLSRLQTSRATRISAYVTINSFVLGASALIIRERGLALPSLWFVLVPLCLAGFLASIQWRITELTYRKLIAFRVSKLREIEDELSNLASISRMYHAEDELYPRDIGAHSRKALPIIVNLEPLLPVAFLVLYASFILAAIASAILPVGSS